MTPHLSMVTLGVKDLKRSREFYRNALGWEPATGSDDHIVFYNHGRIVFALYPHVGLADDANLAPERSGFSGVSLAINLDTKEAVGNLYKQVTANGAKSLVEHRETFWGGYDCYFADPDVHHWEIAWAPLWKFDEQGSLIL